MKKILFVAPNLNPGGAEKVLVTIINNLVLLGYDCELILFKREGELLEILSTKVRVTSLPEQNIFLRVYNLKCSIKNIAPDVVFSIIGHVNVILAFLKVFFFRKLKFIARENVVHSVWFTQDTNMKKKLLLLSYKIFLKKLDIIIVQSEFMKNDIVSMFKVEADQVKVLKNSVDSTRIESELRLKLDDNIQWNSEKKHIIAVGRIEKVKDYPRMLNIIKRIPEDYILDIFGKGSEEEFIKVYIQEHGLENRVFLHGYNKNVYKYMSKSECLLLTSTRESFPNVVVEANACGIPALCLNIPGGIKEVISESYINGQIFYSDGELIDFIETNKLNSFSSENIKSYVSEHFSIENFIYNIKTLIESEGDKK